MILRSLIFTIGFAFGAFAQAVAQMATPAPTPQYPPSGAPEPSATATLTPGPTTPTPVVSATPTPGPTAAPPTSSPAPPSPYKYVVDPTPNPAAPPGTPQILKIEVNDQTLHPGGQVAIRVTTTANVKRVIATAAGHDIEIQKAQEGLFAGMTMLPWFIPPWMLRTYQVTFTATTTDGKRSATTIPLTLSR